MRNPARLALQLHAVVGFGRHRAMHMHIAVLSGGEVSAHCQHRTTTCQVLVVGCCFGSLVGSCAVLNMLHRCWHLFDMEQWLVWPTAARTCSHRQQFVFSVPGPSVIVLTICAVDNIGQHQSVTPVYCPCSAMCLLSMFGRTFLQIALLFTSSGLLRWLFLRIVDASCMHFPWVHSPVPLVTNICSFTSEIVALMCIASAAHCTCMYCIRIPCTILHYSAFAFTLPCTGLWCPAMHVLALLCTSSSWFAFFRNALHALVSPTFACLALPLPCLTLHCPALHRCAVSCRCFAACPSHAIQWTLQVVASLPCWSCSGPKKNASSFVYYLPPCSIVVHRVPGVGQIQYFLLLFQEMYDFLKFP